MSALLNKRLARSLWRTKLRLVAVVMMVAVGVFSEKAFLGILPEMKRMLPTLMLTTKLPPLLFGL